MSSIEPNPTNEIRAVAISGSPSPASRSRLLLEHVAARLESTGIPPARIELSRIPADELLGRSRGPAIEHALSLVASARIVIVSTPVYRATYSGLLKVFFDLFEANALVGKTAIPIATGGSPSHQLVLDHGLRPLLASVGALVVPTGTYGTDAQFRAGAIDPALLTRLDRSVAEAIDLIRVAEPAF